MIKGTVSRGVMEPETAVVPSPLLVSNRRHLMSRVKFRRDERSF